MKMKTKAPMQKPSSRRQDHELPEAVAKLGWRYHHLGIPTNVPRPGEVHLAHFGMHVSGFQTSPYGIEWMRFNPDCPVSELVRSVPHVAFEVDDLDAALEGKTLQGKVCSPSKDVRVAMIIENGAPIELLEFRGRRMNARKRLAREVTGMERRLARAQRDRNRPELETLVAPEYEGIDPHGRSMTRGKFLTAFTSPKLKLRKLELSDLSVRNYGQVALVSGRSAVRGAFQNKPFNASAMLPTSGSVTGPASGGWWRRR
jgi:hypothetical protein